MFLLSHICPTLHELRKTYSRGTGTVSKTLRSTGGRQLSRAAPRPPHGDGCSGREGTEGMRERCRISVSNAG